MLAAVYYPYTAIRDENFLKHAVLYWDEIEYISPRAGFDDLPRYSTTAMQRLSRVLTPRVPTGQEKQRAHEEIMSLVKDDLPQWLKLNRLSTSDDRQTYTMFADKLLPDTWKELKDRRLVEFRRYGDFDDYVSHTFLGLTLMAILAKSCAGDLKHTITDQNDSYFSLLKHLAGLGEGQKVQTAEGSSGVFTRWLEVLNVSHLSAEDKARKTLVSITLDVIDAAELSVETLLELRADKTQLMTELRQNYSKSIEDYVTQMSIPDLKETDAKALASDFKRKMELDRDRLYSELRLSALKSVLSKELAVGVMAPIAGASILAASGIGSVLGGTLAIGALAKLGVEYRSGRNAVFQKHPMAFLYANKGVRLY